MKIGGNFFRKDVMLLLQITIGAIFGIGLFLILADRMRIPYFATSKAINNLAKRNNVKTSTIDIWLKDFAIWLSKHIRLNEYRNRDKVQAF